MIGMTMRLIAATTCIMSGLPVLAAAQSNACSLLTSAEVVKHIDRGQKSIGQEPQPTSLSGGNGLICQYEFGQIGVWRAPNAEQNLENSFKAWKAEIGKRNPVSGVGDRAWIAFPVPRSQYEDRPAYVVAHVGQQIVTVALFAHDGNADGMAGQACRGDQSKMRPREKEDCKAILADKSETQESLQPAAVELAKLVVAKVRSGKP